MTTLEDYAECISPSREVVDVIEVCPICFCEIKLDSDYSMESHSSSSTSSGGSSNSSSNNSSNTQEATTITCRNAHNLQLSTSNIAWRCDAISESEGCHSGDGASYELATRWRCGQCDFDYCGLCYDSKLDKIKTFQGGCRLRCLHAFCSICLQEFIKYEVKSGNINLKCFGKVNNSHNISDNNNNTNFMNKSSSNSSSSYSTSDNTVGRNYSTTRSINDSNNSNSSNSNSNNNNNNNTDGTNLQNEQGKCNRAIELIDIERIFAKSADGPATIKLYSKFKILKSSNFARECPYCHDAEVYDDDDLPIVNCRGCKSKFCFYHSLAHKIDVKCEDYEAQQAPLMKESLDIIYSNTKPCPKCTLLVEKTGGCNHMKCTYCKQSFCWVCGQAIDDSVFPAHFQWWNVFGCSNMQMDDAIEVDRGTVLRSKLLGILEIILIGPLTLISTLASILACPCMIYCCNSKETKGSSFRTKLRDLFSNLMTTWGMIWISLLFFFPLFTLAGVLLTAVFIVIYPCLAFVRIRKNQHPCPDFIISICNSLRLCFCRCFINTADVQASTPDADLGEAPSSKTVDVSDDKDMMTADLEANNSGGGISEAVDESDLEGKMHRIENEKEPLKASNGDEVSNDVEGFVDTGNVFLDEVGKGESCTSVLIDEVFIDIQSS